MFLINRSQEATCEGYHWRCNLPGVLQRPRPFCLQGKRPILWHNGGYTARCFLSAICRPWGNFRCDQQDSRHSTRCPSYLIAIVLSTPPLQALVGNLDSRKELLSLTETIYDSSCASNIGSCHLNTSSLAIYFMRKGRFTNDTSTQLSNAMKVSSNVVSYKRHVDTTVKRDESIFECGVSLILYLGDPSLDERPWDYVRDAGALRICPLKKSPR